MLRQFVLFAALMTIVSAANADFVMVQIPGAIETDNRGVANDGDIVGQYFDSSGIGHGFYLPNGASPGAATLLDFPGADSTAALGVNNLGQVVGTYTAGSTTAGFIYQSGTYTSVSVPGSSTTSGFGINDAGQIVGTYTSGWDPERLHHGGCRWRVTTVNFPGGTTTNVNGIDTAGDVVGSYSAGGTDHGFTRTAGGTFTAIDAPGASGAGTFGNGLNDTGTVIGTYELAGTDRAFTLTSGVYARLSRTGIDDHAGLRRELQQSDRGHLPAQS